MKEFEDLYKLINELVDINNRTNEENCLQLLQNQLDCISEIRNSLSTDDEIDYKQKFRQYKDLLEILHQCPFGKYVNDKPRGYPGDYVTQEMIISGRKYNEHRYLGTTPAGKLLSSLTYNMPACAANEFRLQYIKEQISQSGYNIASIGSGSGIEYWDIDNEFFRSHKVFLLDQDSEALKSAKRNITNCNSVTFHQDNILKFILCNDKNEILNSKDFIYMIGLLDYFTIKQSKKIVSSLWKNVKSKGKLLLTNAHPKNPTKLWMEYVSDWYLNYKTREEMFQIIENLPDIGDSHYEIDIYNVYQYITISKE